MSAYVEDGQIVMTFAFDPLIAQIGPLQLGWHGLFTALAIVISIWMVLRIAGRRGLPTDRIADVAMWGVAGGIVGARLFHVLDHIPQYAANPLDAFAIWQGGIAVYGAFIGGVVAGWIAARLMGLPVWPLLDLAGPAMLVGQAIGRLGCLSNGDAWGEPCGDGIGICIAYVHPNALLPDPLRGVPTHAYPLYEIIFGVVLLALIWGLHDRLRAPGQTFVFAALGYALMRFLLTYFRQETQLIVGLQEAQIVAIVTAIIVIVAYALKPKGATPASTPA